MAYKIKISQYEIDIDVILLYAFVAATIVYYLFQGNSIANYIRIAVLMLGALWGYMACVKQRFLFPLGLAAFFLACWLICYFMRSVFQPTHETSIEVLTFTLCYIGMAVFLLQSRVGKWGSGILLVACAGIIVFRYFQGMDSQDVVFNNSRNYVSVLLLFCILLYYLALYQSGRRGLLLVLLPAAVYFGICIVAYGRGGILTSGFLLAALFVYEFLNIKTKHQRRGLRLFLLIVVALVVLYFGLSQRVIISLGKFSVSVVDAARLNIWSQFFKNNVRSPVELLCGSDVLLIRDDGNAHNSFLQCYAVYGVIAFGALIVLSVKAVVDGIRHRDFFWTVLILTLFIRAFTDRLFYQGYCELFLYYFIMHWRYQKIVAKD